MLISIDTNSADSLENGLQKLKKVILPWEPDGNSPIAGYYRRRASDQAIVAHVDGRMGPFNSFVKTGLVGYTVRSVLPTTISGIVGERGWPTEEEPPFSERRAVQAAHIEEAKAIVDLFLTDEFPGYELVNPVGDPGICPHCGRED
jgi:hypothetical protein